MTEKYKIVICEFTNKEVVAVWDEQSRSWLHLHNEIEKHDAEDVEYFKMTGVLLKRDTEENILGD